MAAGSQGVQGAGSKGKTSRALQTNNKQHMQVGGQVQWGGGAASKEEVREAS